MKSENINPDRHLKHTPLFRNSHGMSVSRLAPKRLKARAKKKMMGIFTPLSSVEISQTMQLQEKIHNTPGWAPSLLHVDALFTALLAAPFHVRLKKCAYRRKFNHCFLSVDAVNLTN